jgi:hypothetical protein
VAKAAGGLYQFRPETVETTTGEGSVEQNSLIQIVGHQFTHRDVLNSEGYTQASWWNRIPIAAWALMGLIAICSNFFIADLDSPRTGVIRVRPLNLMSVSRGLRTPKVYG